MVFTMRQDVIPASVVGVILCLRAADHQVPTCLENQAIAASLWEIGQGHNLPF